jgi:hypothetical protein
MLDHDELLPEEQAHPVLIQQLRATYQMRPEEKQVLTRVHERLAQSAHELPLLESVQEERSVGMRQRVSPISPSSQTKIGQRWLSRLNMLAAVIIIGLLISLLALTLSIVHHTSTGGLLTNDIHILLVPADKSSHPTHAEMATTSALLSQRFRSFGLQSAQARVLTINGQPAIEADLPHFGGNEQQTINTLLETGTLAFWDTGSQSVAIGTTFNPQQYLQYNPGGQPSFTGRDLDPQYLAVTQDQAGRPQINCEMKAQAIHRFQTYTADRIGIYLTITLDGKVLESATIESAIAGPFTLNGAFTQQRASALVSVLISGPLPVALKQVA